MADTTESSLQIVTQAIGGNDDTWGGIQAANNAKFITAIAEVLDLTGLTGGTTALSDDQNRNAILQCSGTLASSQTITVNAAEKWWHVINDTSGSYTLTVKTSAGSGVTVPQGGAAILYCDATNVRSIIDTNLMTGMGTVTDNRLTKTDGTAGTAIQQTGITVSDTDDITGVNDLTVGGDVAVTGDVSAATATIAGIVGKGATSGILVPAGTTGERSGTDTQLRVNTTTDQLEGYFPGSASWRQISTTEIPLPPPQGYLTLQSGAPMPSSDQSAATAVYYTPVAGLQAPIHDGSSLTPRALSGELTLTLASAHIANTIYDVFLDHNAGGAVRIGTSPGWSVSGAGSGARGTGAGTTELTTLQGFEVNANSMTVRNGASTWTVAANEGTYVGSILIDGTNGQISCLPDYGQTRKWGVWNAFNQKTIRMKAGDSTPNWTSGSTSFAASHGDSNNTISAFVGLANNGIIECDFHQLIVGGIAIAYLGVGVDSTSAASGYVGTTLVRSGDNQQISAHHAIGSLLGVSAVNMLEKVSSNTQYNGTEANMQLVVSYRG